MVLTKAVLSEKLKTDPAWYSRAMIFLADTLKKEGAFPVTIELSHTDIHDINWYSQYFGTGRSFPVDSDSSRTVISLVSRQAIVDFIFDFVVSRVQSAACTGP